MTNCLDEELLTSVTPEHLERQRNELIRLFAQITNERQRKSILEIVCAAAYANQDRAA